MSKYEVNPFTNKKVMAKVVDFTSFDHQGQGHSEVKVIQRSWHVQDLTQRKIECKYEVNPFTNKKVMAKVVDFTTFGHQGQGHSEVKVTQKYGRAELLPNGTLCPSMN